MRGCARLRDARDYQRGQFRASGGQFHMILQCGQDSGGSLVLSIGNEGGSGAPAGAEIDSGFLAENVGNGVPGT